MGKITKNDFSIVAENLIMKITTNHNFATMVTGHGRVN